MEEAVKDETADLILLHAKCLNGFIMSQGRNKAVFFAFKEKFPFFLLQGIDVCLHNNVSKEIKVLY